MPTAGFRLPYSLPVNIEITTKLRLLLQSPRPVSTPIVISFRHNHDPEIISSPCIHKISELIVLRIIVNTASDNSVEQSK
jgi:hypothetical protein